MACLVNDANLFDTPGGPGDASIVERKDFQAKQPLCKIRHWINHLLDNIPIYTYIGTTVFQRAVLEETQLFDER